MEVNQEVLCLSLSYNNEGGVVHRDFKIWSKSPVAQHIKSSSALKFARLHGHAVLRPAVRVHHELVVVGAVGERAHERLLIGRLRAERGLVVLVGVLHDLGDTGAAEEERGVFEVGFMAGFYKALCMRRRSNLTWTASLKETSPMELREGYSLPSSRSFSVTS